MVFGQPQEAALGVEHYMCVDVNSIRMLMAEGTKAIEREITLHGSEVDKESLAYVLFGTAGASHRTFSNGNLRRDCGPDGLPLRCRLRNDGKGLQLSTQCNTQVMSGCNLPEASNYLMILFWSLKPAASCSFLSVQRTDTYLPQ